MPEKNLTWNSFMEAMKALKQKAQTIGGVWTFYKSPTVPTPTLGDNSQKAANTAYIESFIGLSPNKRPVLRATIAPLPAHTQSADGLTLTADNNGAFPMIDFGTMSAGQRILVKNEKNASWLSNGIFTITSLGGAGAKWVLTRASDCNTAAGVEQGSFVFVRGGIVNYGVTFLQNNFLGGFPGNQNWLDVNWKQKFKSVDYATTTALPANTMDSFDYRIMTANVNGAFPAIDGITVPGAGYSILVKDESNTTKNGIYVVFEVGDATKPWVLIRRTDSDEYYSMDGVRVVVLRGTANGGKVFAQTADMSTGNWNSTWALTSG